MQSLTLLIFFLLSLSGCAKADEKRAHFGKPSKDFDMALGIGRRFDFVDGETNVEIIGDAIIPALIFGKTGATGVVLTAVQTGEVKLNFLKGNVVGQQFTVSAHDGPEKTLAVIKEQLAFEKDAGIPVSFKNLSVGKCLPVKSSTGRELGAFYLTQPNVAAANRDKAELTVCALKTGFTDITVYDESMTLITHLFLQVIAP